MCFFPIQTKSRNEQKCRQKKRKKKIIHWKQARDIYRKKYLHTPEKKTFFGFVFFCEINSEEF